MHFKQVFLLKRYQIGPNLVMGWFPLKGSINHTDGSQHADQGLILRSHVPLAISREI